MKNNKSQEKLFEDIENLNWREEWLNMPEFIQDDLNPVKKLIVNFETEKDYKKFVKLLKIEDSITDKTKSIWFPIQEKELPKNFGYIFEEDEK